MALHINGVELDFDFTSPEDFRRYQTATEQMAEAVKTIEDTAADLDADAAYVKTIEGVIRLFSAFLNEVFGDGTAAKLLGEKPGLTKLTEIQNAITAGAEAQSRAVAAHFSRYTPNRESR